VKNVAAIILAAGSSSRMGQSKQLLAWKSETLLSHTVNIVNASKVDAVYVVLGANEQAHRNAITNSNVTILSNLAWAKGMGSSIKVAVNEVQQNPLVDGVLLLVCDQPFLSTLHLNTMLEAFEKQKRSIITSVYDRTNGVPVLFGKKHFAALMTIGDSEGAKKVISSAQEEVIGIMFPEGSVDIDTPEEYSLARKGATPPES
jgi:molybdenum cofactor cytidylyltransferase